MDTSNTQKVSLNILAVTMLGLSLIAGLFVAPGNTQAAPAYQAAAVKVTTVPANGTTTLTARGFCMAFGKPFPTGTMGVNGLASTKVQNALNYSIGKGYAAGNAEQVQLAIWYLQDNTWHNQNNTVAQEIVNSSGTGTMPTANALALTDALAQKSVNISASFVAQTADAFYGDGKVTITNTTNADLNVYMPIGVVFTVPNGNGQFQDLAAYELVQAEGTPTVGATATAAATSTAAETSTPLATVTAEASATSVATVEVTTPTEVATVEVSTPTEVPTVEVATPTETPVAAPLPQTGDNSTPTTALALLMAALAMLGLGLFMRLKKA
jgi:LPXTG-motif cell wall-anchored protein